MSVVLARIDDRLIHGQVTVGWSQQLQPDRILLANDAVAADSWQSRVYSASVPPEIKVSIFSLAEAAEFLEANLASSDDEKILLLTGSPAEMAKLVELGAVLTQVNVGGIHFSNGRLEMLPFVYVDQSDLNALQALLDGGYTLSAQQVPGGREVIIEADQLKLMEERF